MKILIIPDCHASPAYDNTRFEWLGELIVDERPDTIVQIGDFADLPSLSSYDMGKRSFEGRRLVADLGATKDALEKLFFPLKDLNSILSRNHKTQYRPRVIFVLGNHEDRLSRATQNDPHLDGLLDCAKLGYEEYGEVVPFQDVISVAGFHFSHYFAGGMGRPLGGKNLASRILSEKHVSCVVGHSHLLDIAERTRADGAKICAIVSGCYVHPSCVEDWNRGTVDQWWNGVVLLDGAREGYYDRMSLITQTSIQARYGRMCI
jgi:predicted phosphodiesterase